MLHCLLARQPLLMVYFQYLVEQVQRLWRDEVLVVIVDIPVPAAAGKAYVAEHLLVDGLELETVPSKVFVQGVGPEHLHDLQQLVVVVFALKQRVNHENEAAKHAAE